jgi:hypothetical protein
MPVLRRRARRKRNFPRTTMMTIAVKRMTIMMRQRKRMTITRSLIACLSCHCTPRTMNVVTVAVTARMLQNRPRPTEETLSPGEALRFRLPHAVRKRNK